MAQHREQARVEAVKNLPFVDDALLCDEELGCFSIIDTVQPDLFVLVHDQMALEESLRAWMLAHERYLPIHRMKKKPL